MTITKEQAMQWAREAGFNVKNFIPPVITAQHSNGSWVSIGDELEALAQLAFEAGAKSAAVDSQDLTIAYMAGRHDAKKSAVSEPCRHRIADARNALVQSGYVCVDCGAVFAAADHAAAVSEPLDLEKIIEEYVEHYEMRGDEGDYTPSEGERNLIKDAIIGLLADPDWDTAWGKHIQSLATPPAEAKREPLTLEQINDIGSTAWCAQDRDSNDPEDDFKVLFARAIEAAHGIGAKE